MEPKFVTAAKNITAMLMLRWDSRKPLLDDMHNRGEIDDKQYNELLLEYYLKPALKFGKETVEQSNGWALGEMFVDSLEQKIKDVEKTLRRKKEDSHDKGRA